MKKEINLGIIGIGYVGLPLACEFAKKRKVICFDIDKKRINQLRYSYDNTKEITQKELKKVKTNIIFTTDKTKLKNVNCFIITVPTPILKSKKPNLKPLINATKTVGKFIKKGDVVIYESTVFPGCTEEVCVPILEKTSKLTYNADFYCGYSPERINPGDKNHKINDIIKITSGSTKKISDFINNLYKEIINAGTFQVESIKIAEAAKVIENTQRDLNIALMNELSIIFNKLNIDTKKVLAAASSKWNFNSFSPGLVGGHCIGVDPYYLTYKSKKIGHNPKVILAGRHINDNMGKYIVKKLLKDLKANKRVKRYCKILIMGLTFKENCPDLRNSGVKIIYSELLKFPFSIDLFDPCAHFKDVERTYKKKMIKKIKNNFYDAVIIAVAHSQFKKMGINLISSFGNHNCIIYDLKNIFSSKKTQFRL